MQRLRIAGIAMAMMVTLGVYAFTVPQALADEPAITSNAIDPMETGSIAQSAGDYRLMQKRADEVHDSASGLAPVSVPAYLSALSDRRLLAVICVIGFCVAWINRTPPNRNDNQS